MSEQAQPLSAQAPSEQAQPVQATPAEPVPKPFYFHMCATATCKCLASYNGGPNEPCSRNCRDAYPCSAAYGSHPCHDTPFEVQAGLVAKRMPSNKQALAEAYVAIKHVLGVHWRRMSRPGTRRTC